MTREHSGANKKRRAENRRPAQPAAQGMETQAAELNPADAIQLVAAAPPGALRPADLLALQRSIGNRATQQLLQKRSHDALPAGGRRPAAVIQRQGAGGKSPRPERERIVFIMGSTKDEFYRSARLYFLQHPRGRTVTNLRSLKAVRDYLAKNRPANGRPWGEINIVVHASLEGTMATKVAKGGYRVNPYSLSAAIKQGTLDALPDDLVDAQTVIHIRGCALGRKRKMLTLLSKAFGGSDRQRPKVYAPKGLQYYGWRARWRKIRGRLRLIWLRTKQRLIEFWYVAWPKGKGPRTRSRVARVAGQVAMLFTLKYPPAKLELAWTELLKKLKRRRFKLKDTAYTYELEYEFPRPPRGRRRRARWLRRILRAKYGKQVRRWREIELDKIEETKTNYMTVHFGYEKGGTNTGDSVDFQTCPKFGRKRRNQAIVAWLNEYGDANESMGEREENAGLRAKDFAWTARDYRKQKTLLFIGKRTMLRVERPLTEQDPTRPGKKRFAQPPATDPRHYGSAAPPS